MEDEEPQLDLERKIDELFERHDKEFFAIMNEIIKRAFEDGATRE